MNIEQVFNVSNYYLSYFKNKYRPHFHINPKEEKEHIQHALWMCETISRNIKDNNWTEEKDWDKINRWLGYIQGIFAVYNIFTIDQMKEHNSKDGFKVPSDNFGDFLDKASEVVKSWPKWKQQLLGAPLDDLF